MTREILEHLPKPLPATGLLNLFVQHTSCALSVNENADPDVRSDMEQILNHLVKEREHLTKEPGSFKGHIYDYLFPKRTYEFSPVLYTPLQSELRDLQSGPFKYKEHIMSKHMASSQCACINLFMPILLDDNASDILKHIPGRPVDFHMIDRTRLHRGFCFEYWGQDIDSQD